MSSVYSKDLISLIKLISIDLDEAVLEIRVDEYLIFNSIEWRREKDQVILHAIRGDVDIEFNYDTMDKDIQRKIYIFLLKNYLN